MTSYVKAEKHNMTVDDEGQAALDAAFATDRDRGADSAAPDLQQDKPAPEQSAEAEKPKDDSDGESSKQYRDPETGRFVPLTELKTERSKRQEEARLRTEAETRAARAEAALEESRRYADFVRNQHGQQYQSQPLIHEPDPFTDPDGFKQFVVGRAQIMAVNERLNMSQMMAEEKYGKDTVAKALEAAQAANVAHNFVNTTNPYGDLVGWFTRREAIAKIGDPTDFEKRIREEERQKVMTELKQGSASQQQQRFPGTLADAPASGAQGRMPLSDQQLLDSLYASDRRGR